MTSFAVIGADHAHILDHVTGLIAAGARFAGYTPDTTVPAIIDAIRARAPDAPARTRTDLLEDPTIDIICTAAIPADRAAIAVDAMNHGKDVIADKPGATTLPQLDALRDAQSRTGRRYAICFSERLCVRAAVRATALVRSGAIGRVVQTLSTGPHRLAAPSRPAWFFDRTRNGGILADIASHQIDQFLHYTGSPTAEILAASVGHYGPHTAAEFEDFGQILLQSPTANGYVRVDWLTPDGLPTWGDGRLILLGTEGFIELRKYIDIAGRPGADHLFLADRTGTTHIDCAADPLPFFAAFLDDVRNRTDEALPQAHVFETTRLALHAEQHASRAHMPPPTAP